MNYRLNRIAHSVYQQFSGDKKRWLRRIQRFFSQRILDLIRIVRTTFFFGTLIELPFRTSANFSDPMREFVSVNYDKYRESVFGTNGRHRGI